MNTVFSHVVPCSPVEIYEHLDEPMTSIFQAEKFIFSSFKVVSCYSDKTVGHRNRHSKANWCVLQIFPANMPIRKDKPCKKGTETVVTTFD
jgi:hypothetical protein